MSLTTSEILERAAALIEPPGAWAKDVYARDEDYRIVNATSPTACRFCALGAILNVMGLDYPYDGRASFDGDPVVVEPIRRLEEIVGEWPPFWQDDEKRTQSEVVTALRDAAAAARDASGDS